MTRPLAAIGGFLAGATLAGFGIVVAPDQPSATPATTTSLATTAQLDTEAWWFSPAETRIGPTAILLEDLSLEDGQVVVRYSPRDLAPQALGRILSAGETNPFFPPPREDPVAAPERWVLETVNGEIVGGSATARATTARFDVPDGFILSTITGLRIESYRMRMPYIYEIELEPITGETVVLDEGFSFTIRAVLPQQSTTILQIDYDTPSDGFTAGEPTPVIISGVGFEWLSYNQRQFEGLQLIRNGSELPPTIRLQVRSTYWIAFGTSIDVDLGGVALG